MSLDAASDGAVGDSRTRTAAAVGRTPARADSPTTLIVDDEPDQLGLLTAYFHRAGCAVIGLGDAEQVLALPRDVQLDLIVLDLRLPGMDGWELTARLRSRYPRCPIVITSVLDVEDYPDADGVLPKPVTRADVRNILAKTIPGWTP